MSRLFGLMGCLLNRSLNTFRLIDGASRSGKECVEEMFIFNDNMHWFGLAWLFYVSRYMSQEKEK